MEENKLAESLRIYMERTQVTQAEFAELVKADQSTISRIRSGKQVPRVDLLARIADVIGFELSEVVYKYLNRPMPPRYEIFTRAAKLSDEKYVTLSHILDVLLQEDEAAEEKE